MKFKRYSLKTRFDFGKGDTYLYYIGRVFKLFSKNLQSGIFSGILVIVIFGSSCKKMLQVPPQPTTINAANVFAVDGTAIAAVNALFTDGNFRRLFLFDGLLADELTLYELNSSLYSPYYRNSLLADPGPPDWENLYRRIFSANASIQGLTATATLTPGVKQQLLGEAKFMRAFFYFYLVNQYGDVPLTLTTDPEVNRLLPRAPVKQVYDQVVNDLTDAQDLLSKTFLAGDVQLISTERVRPTYWAAAALLARVYLYKGEFQHAIDQSNQVIGNSSLFSLTSLNNTFLKNSKETIWAYQSTPVTSMPYNTYEGFAFILPSSGPKTGGEKSFYLSDSIYKSFEAGDDRKVNWVSTVSVGGIVYPFAYKYKADGSQTNVTEYQVVLRLAEQYLIRAEAEARLGNIPAAVSDLNTIRTRARAAATPSVPNPLPDLSSSISLQQLYIAIEQERKVELFTEWGHRWLDLKRTPGFSDPSKTRADEVMPSVCAAKGGIWNSNWKLLPIPREQLQRDPNMTHAQNPGYQ